MKNDRQCNKAWCHAAPMPRHTLVLLQPNLPVSNLPACFPLSPCCAEQPDVRKALGVGDREWEACNMDVHGDMMSDVSVCCCPAAAAALRNCGCLFVSALCITLNSAHMQQAYWRNGLLCRWHTCLSAFPIVRLQWGHNYDVVLPELLTAGVRVMICEWGGEGRGGGLLLKKGFAECGTGRHGAG